MGINIGLVYPYSLRKDGRVIVPEHTGAIVVAGPDGKVVGGCEAETSITGNYSWMLRTRCNGFYWDDLNGMTGAESVPILSRIVAELGTDTPEDASYWDGSCPGVVGRACAKFLLWALLHPEAKWESWPGR
jgi:hypothetical protein